MELRGVASVLVAAVLAGSFAPVPGVSAAGGPGVAAPAVVGVNARGGVGVRGGAGVAVGVGAPGPAPAAAGPVPGAVLEPPVRPPTVLVPFAAPPGPYAAGHRGVDLAAGAGAVVSAPAAGVVVFAGRLVDRGVVSIDHGGGLRSSLEPVTAAVAVGARVAAGAVVGTVDAGHPRCAPAVCVHWGVRLDGVYLDPMALLAPVRVRLLPWDG
ncbi:peptidoglycan DD-metalloendopeptidase family protein [Nakamurella deserti]|uniref:peptidoglycan DD-metalloendopeptidase family protein n=1 Tax=Nakamurella deserti TaxID=2164074 RepID=UPI000DBE3552|nr:peptidoglycan DD-metalloendopeptidase family protein [Nakamurella deserti]